MPIPESALNTFSIRASAIFLFAGSQAILPMTNGELDFGLISITAENDADWWVIVHGHDLPLEIIEVEIHLPCVARAEWADFQIE